jgi:hypothetical protein
MKTYFIYLKNQAEFAAFTEHVKDFSNLRVGFVRINVRAKKEVWASVEGATDKFPLDYPHEHPIAALGEGKLIWKSTKAGRVLTDYVQPLHWCKTQYLKKHNAYITSEEAATLLPPAPAAKPSRKKALVVMPASLANQGVTIDGKSPHSRDKLMCMLNLVDGKLLEKVTAETSFVVSDSKNQSLKVKQAKKLNIPLITHAHFEAILNENPDIREYLDVGAQIKKLLVQAGLSSLEKESLALHAKALVDQELHAVFTLKWWQRGQHNLAVYADTKVITAIKENIEKSVSNLKEKREAVHKLTAFVEVE